jgi:hypothetical protein
MSRLEVPLLHKLLWATGDELLRAELELLVCDRNQLWIPIVFRVDSGTEMSSMAAARAKFHDFPYPKHAISGLTRRMSSGRVTTEVRPRVLKARVAGMDGTVYWLPCYFLGDPDAPLPTHGPPDPCLLGLTGVIDKLRLTFDGTPTPAASYGNLIVEKP